MKDFKPLIVAVFLVIGGLLFGSLFLTKTGMIEERGILGGPAPLVSSAQGAEVDSAAVLTVGTTPSLSAGVSNDGTAGATISQDQILTDGGAVRDPGEPIGPAVSRSGLISYTVQAGDNLSRIAAYFGVSADTIISANPGVKGSLLRAGQQLKILPTTGVVYEAKAGDTLASISSSFDISQDKITQFNPSVNFAALDPGTAVIIPGGKNIQAVSQGASLPNFNSEFILPAKGYNWGILHHYNAVDIANSCGTPVVASAEGLVVPDENIPDTLDGWNGGYGNFILIEHPFGSQVETRYAHLEKMFVQVGEYVKQGQEIGLMGESGEASGCHVHFEVIGAKNPFAKS